MGERKSAKPKFSPRQKYELQVGQTADETGRNVAALLTGPEIAACRVITGAERSSGMGENIDIPTLLALLRDQAAAVNGGNLAQAEAMLMNQATALQTVFARLVERGMGCTEIPAFEVNLRMGLRAQSQCRATLETLAAIKNPASVAFVRQANIAHGPQQVNNGTPAPSRPRENETEPNKLSGGSDELLPDTRASALASRIDPPMEAVEKIDGAEIRRG